MMFEPVSEEPDFELPFGPLFAHRDNVTTPWYLDCEHLPEWRDFREQFVDFQKK